MQTGKHLLVQNPDDHYVVSHSAAENNVSAHLAAIKAGTYIVTWTAGTRCGREPFAWQLQSVDVFDSLRRPPRAQRILADAQQVALCAT